MFNQPVTDKRQLAAVRRPRRHIDRSLPAEADPLLLDALTVGVRQLVPVSASETVFTDDHAPVETLVDSLVLNFLFSGGVEQLSN